MFEKNTVILSLKDYLDLIKENERLKKKVEYLDKDNHNLSIEIRKWKNLILEEAEQSTIWNYDDFELERIIDIEDWTFGLLGYKQLLQLGFTLEELIDYIKERREYFENEEKEDE